MLLLLNLQEQRITSRLNIEVSAKTNQSVSPRMGFVGSLDPRLIPFFRLPFNCHPTAQEAQTGWLDPQVSILRAVHRAAAASVAGGAWASRRGFPGRRPSRSTGCRDPVCRMPGLFGSKYMSYISCQARID